MTKRERVKAAIAHKTAGQAPAFSAGIPDARMDRMDVFRSVRIIFRFFQPRHR